ncbi:MAG: UDP-glucose 4-epimerase [Parcubacteria group bacterium Gr01-1014_72]|nr:MAG: UDP-glucose 4-epimerase [Parcubacteria group bacterium Gr01-1014_72]
MISNRKRKILILGGAGFVGQNLTRFLLRRGAGAVTIVDSLDPLFGSTRESLSDIVDKITFIQGDIRDPKLLKRVIPGADVIFNCVGQTSHPHSLIDPFLDADINCIGTLRVLTAVRDFNPKARVIFTGSSTVVGRGEHPVVDETHPEAPLDIYSAHKGVAEKYHRIFHTVYDIPTVVLRFANLYGPYGKNDPSFGFVNHFLGQAIEGKPIIVWGDGAQTRNVLFIEDACEALMQAAEHQKLVGTTHFVVHDDHHTVREVAEAIAETFGGRVESVPWPDVRRRIDVESVRISGARFQKLTGWRPKHSLRQGLERTKKMFKQKSK